MTIKVRPSYILLGLIILSQSCKKTDNTTSDCFSNSATTRQIVNKLASIKLIGGQYYIIEQGTIDTKLKPCSLTEEFQVDNLMVTISGDVKSTVQDGSTPCCIENFVVKSISR